MRHKKEEKTGWEWIFISIAIVLYILYFSVFSIQRYKTLYASYYDLGIMHQTVFNTYRALQTFNFSRILQMTNTEGPGQIYRMAIHNDILLAFLAPFYFVSSSPATLLIIQTAVLAAGAVVMYKLCKKLFEHNRHSGVIAAIFAFAWLMYVPMERSNIYDFHAVVLATTFLLCMYYFWLVKRYKWSLFFFVLSMFSKEQVALTTFFFGIYALLHEVRYTLFFGPLRYAHKIKQIVTHDKANMRYALIVIVTSVIWFVLSVFVIIPFFRGGHHFASSRYGDFGESPAKILLGILYSPLSVGATFIHHDAPRYLYFLTGSLGFLSVFSPVHLLIATPEFTINMLSNSGNMRNIIFHYTAVIQPFVFISAAYGFRNIVIHLSFPRRRESRVLKDRPRSPIGVGDDKLIPVISIYILIMTLAFSYVKSPLWYSKEHEIHPFVYPQKEAVYVLPWSKILRDENIKVTTTGQLAPFFTNRKYYYVFSKYYNLADYVIIRPNEVYTYSDKDQLIPVYDALRHDKKFRLIEKKDNFEVYKKI